MRQRRSLFLGLLPALLATGLVERATSAPVALPGSNGLIAFVSDRAGHFPGGSVYVARADGSRRVDLGGTTEPENHHPTWTREGKRVVYAGTDGLLVARADGTGRRLISTPVPPYEPRVSPTGREVVFSGGWVVRLPDGVARRVSGGDDATWSPDGRRLAFVRTTQEGRERLGVVNSDGSRLRWLTSCFGCGMASDEETLTWSPDGSKILFTRARPKMPGDVDIHVVDVSTKRLRNLRRTNGTQEGNPVWSPEGRRTAVLGGRGKRASIYVMRADGSAIKRVARVSGHAASGLTWSPRGGKLAYLRSSSIEIINLSGKRVGSVSSPRCHEVVRHVAWSPRGDRLAFSAHRYLNDTDVFVVSADGEAAKRLTNNCVSEFEPAWSPDGRRVAYVRETRGGAREIFAMDADGADVRRLTNSKQTELKPTWSPSGDELAFARSFSRDNEIFRMSSTGGRGAQITNTPGSNWDAAWSSRNEIAFTSTRDTRRQIYVMQPDGSGQRRLTDGSFHASDPGWSPDGTKVVFVGNTGLTADLWVIPAAGGEMKRLTNLGNYIPASDPAWSPDGQRIVLAVDFDSGKDSRHALAVVSAAGGTVTRLPYEPIDNLTPDWQRVPLP